MADPVQNQGPMPGPGDVTASQNSGVDTQNAPDNEQLQTPAQAPAPKIDLQPAAAAATQPQAAPAPKPDPDQHHTVVGKIYHSVLSSLGGAQSQTPVTDMDPKSPTYGQTKMVPTPKTPGSQWRSIISAMVAGAAAGASTGYDPKKPTAAFGAGAQAAEAQKDKQAAQSQQALEQKQKEFAETQQAKIHQLNIGKGNAELLDAYHKSLMSQNSMDPQFAQNQGIIDELGKNETGPQPVIISSDELKEKLKDPKFQHDNIIMPLGAKPKTDADGNPIIGPDGVTPMTQGSVAIIPGGHDGKFPLPADMVSRMQELSKMGLLTDIDGVDKIQPGMDVDMKTFAKYNHEINESEAKRQNGWMEKKLGENAVSDGKDGWMQLNPITGEKRAYPGGVPQSVVSAAATINKKDTSGDVTPAEVYRANVQKALKQMEIDAKKSSDKGDKDVAATKNELQKQATDFGKFNATYLQGKGTIQAAMHGDQLASSLAPLQSALMITSANGIHRINMTEVERSGDPKMGSLARRVDAALEKAGNGKLPMETLKEMDQLFDRYADATYTKYLKGANYTATLRKQDPTQTMIIDKNGDPITIADALNKLPGKGLPSAPAGQVAVLIPGAKRADGQPDVRFLNKKDLPKFKEAHPNATIGED